jgi:hypothetical protein
MADHGRIPIPLRLCRGCRQFVRYDESAGCAFCGGNLDALQAEHEQRLETMRRAAAALREAIRRRDSEGSGEDTAPHSIH